MKKTFFICSALLLCFVFTGSAFSGGMQNHEERFGWQIEGASWSNDSFSYIKRETVADVSITGAFPALLLDNLSQSNSCAPATGTNLLQYYDGIYPELVPDSNPFLTNGGGYAKINGKAEALAEGLYTSMKTNKNGSGTTLGDYKAALQTYVAKQGLKITYASSMDSYFFNLFTRFDLDYYISCINQKKPVSLIVKNIQYAEEGNFKSSATQANIAIQNIGPSHILIGYGYVKYNYYAFVSSHVWSPVWYNPFRFVQVIQESVFRTDEYLKVSFGNGTLGYLNLNKSTITDAFTSHITR